MKEYKCDWMRTGTSLWVAALGHSLAVRVWCEMPVGQFVRDTGSGDFGGIDSEPQTLQRWFSAPVQSCTIFVSFILLLSITVTVKWIVFLSGCTRSS